jgi:glycosyltransferase involved in cell wall biosynthesis
MVLHLIDSFGLGGAQQRYFNDLRYLTPSLQHRACAVFGNAKEAPQAAGLEQPLSSLQLEQLSDLPAGLRRLVRVLRSDPSIKLIHTQLFSADILGRIAGALCGRVVVSTVQSAVYEPDSGLNSRWRYWTDRSTANLVSHFIAVSKFVGESVHRRLSVPTEKITVMPNTVDVKIVKPESQRRSQHRKVLDIPDGTFVWMTVGRLHPAKGYEYLLKAAAQVVKVRPSTILLMVGSGAQLPDLQARVADLEIGGHVRFLGDRADVQDLLDASDGFVFTSLSEGLPVSLLEAMAMRKACVASRIGPHEELIDDRVSGLLTPPRNSTALAESMCTVQDQPELRSRLAAAAQDRVIHHFAAQAGAARLAALYDTLVK